jgi:hypothetical protein
MIRLVRWLASKLQCRRIEAEDGELYLMRFKIFGWMPGDQRHWPFSIYLHRFVLADLDKAPHSHPWKWAVSLILTGGYREELVVKPSRARFYYGNVPMLTRVRGPGSFGLLRNSTYHRVSRLYGETWTLFIVGPRASSWSFLVPWRGPVPWRERLAERGIPT